MKEILKVNNLIKKFPKAGGEIDDADAISVLKGINFDVEQGEYVGIMGKSGCGKTTLLKILGFMDQQTDGGTNQWSDAMVIPKNAKNPELAHAFINYASDYDGAYDNSSYVGYTSANKKVMKDLYGKGGEFEGIDAYIPRTDNKNDEVFEYNEETKKEISNLWSKVKIAASNTN